MTWKELALEYRREIEALWKDIESACDVLYSKQPKSFAKGIHLLDKSLDFSSENVRILEYGEPIDDLPYQSKLISQKRNMEEESTDNEDYFKWLRNSKS